MAEQAATTATARAAAPPASRRSRWRGSAEAPFASSDRVCIAIVFRGIESLTIEGSRRRTSAPAPRARGGGVRPPARTVEGATPRCYVSWTSCGFGGRLANSRGSFEARTRSRPGSEIRSPGGNKVSSEERAIHEPGSRKSMAGCGLRGSAKAGPSVAMIPAPHLTERRALAIDERSSNHSPGGIDDGHNRNAFLGRPDQATQACTTASQPAVRRAGASSAGRILGEDTLLHTGG